MSRWTPKNAWITIAIGGTLVVLSMLLFFTIYGSGPTFPPSQVYTWPLSVIGGVLVGYAVADLASVGDGRLPRIGLALVGGTVAWTGQLVIQALVNPAVDFHLSDTSDYLIGLAIAGVVVALLEVWFVLTQRRSLR